MSARLMSKSEPGRVLISGYVYKRAAAGYRWDGPHSIHVKGKEKPITVHWLEERQEQTHHYLLGIEYVLPMVGRQTELALIQEKLQLAIEGQGQIIGLTAEAGMGKSRLRQR